MDDPDIVAVPASTMTVTVTWTGDVVPFFSYDSVLLVTVSLDSAALVAESTSIDQLNSWLSSVNVASSGNSAGSVTLQFSTTDSNQVSGSASASLALTFEENDPFTSFTSTTVSAGEDVPVSMIEYGLMVESAASPLTLSVSVVGTDASIVTGTTNYGQSFVDATISDASSLVSLFGTISVVPTNNFGGVVSVVVEVSDVDSTGNGHAHG